MDERIIRDDYREIVQSLSIIRLQGWLIQRFMEGTIDDAELIERLEDINQQSGRINDILNTIRNCSPNTNDWPAKPTSS